MTACAQDEAVIRELLNDVDQATTEAAQRLRMIAADVGLLITAGVKPEVLAGKLASRLEAEAARLELMGRRSTFRDRTGAPIRRADPASEEGIVGGTFGPGTTATLHGSETVVPVMSHESLGLRKPKGGADGEE